MGKQYQVLARKWRPQRFDEVVGQDHVITTLKNAIEQNRLAHAYLFVGPRGVGKTSTARIFAKALNCVKGPTVTPCGTCDNCVEIAEGRSLDVLEIDGASNRGIDEVRELRDTVRYAPSRGRFKIYIIDEVHMLTKEAFNALLKTLEEPPPHVKFFFATTEPHKVLPTILSRCQRFDLRRIPTPAMIQHLRKIAKAEKIQISDAALAAIARGAEGGLRDAESTLDQLIAFCGDRIEETDVLSMFGLAAQDQLTGLVDALIEGDVVRALRVVRDLDEAGKDLQRLLADLLDYWRHLLVLSLGEAAASELDVADSMLETMRRQAQRLDTDAILRVLDVLSAAENRIRYALSKRLVLEIALIKAIKSRQAVGLDAVIRRLTELKTLGTASAPASTPVGQPTGRSAPTDPAKPNAEVSLEDLWAGAVEHLGKVTPLAKSCLVGTKPLGWSGAILRVGFDPEFADRMEFVMHARNLEVLTAFLRERLRRDVSIKFEPCDELRQAPGTTHESPSAAPSALAAEARPAARGPANTVAAAPVNMDEFRNDPMIKKALEIFKGSIVEVRK
ncbi:MAG: DNA polymerase III subunit gamma/tau [Verrucomicrobiae bacterium]|nr:DNA polymerase III subunit gamma/tau [Verrucomicrobiae bacterium]